MRATQAALNSLKRSNHFIDMTSHKLHVVQFIDELSPAIDKPSVLLLHGAISNSNVFYSSKNQGLGPFLARSGFNVFCADLRGRGLSEPKLRNDFRDEYGFTEIICETLPRLTEFVQDVSGQSKAAWISHSFGGVMMASAIARHQNIASAVSSQVHFGAKRVIGEIYSTDFAYQIMFGWNFLCPLLAKYYGYVPAQRFKIGTDDESTKFLHDSIRWLRRGSAWGGLDDGFDYGRRNAELIEKGSVPPAWHIAGAGDRVLGNPKDVHRWLVESCGTGSQHKFTILSRANGNAEDYDHKTMLTSKNCDADVFPAVADWIRQHSQP